MEKNKAYHTVSSVGQWLRNSLLVLEGGIPEECIPGGTIWKALEKDYENIGNFKDACDWAIDNNDNYLANEVILEKIKDNSNQLVKILTGFLSKSDDNLTLFRNCCAITANCRFLDKTIHAGPKKANITPKNFRSLIQRNDKDAVLKRLHELIDGKGGVAVAVVLYKARDERTITKYPTEEEYTSEFELIGSFDSIRKGLRDKNGSVSSSSEHINIM